MQLAQRTAVSQLLRNALPTGPIDPDALSDPVFVTFEGTFLLCRSANTPTYTRAQLTVLRQLLESLLDTNPASGPRSPGRATAGSSSAGGDWVQLTPNGS
ncbi:hypothetical protein GCM10009745_70580 [Kribbella yunnanensis]|uniref:Uncharacterized protein n=1 Tax=Kribbella yunnanensis TaxID=190194 RepID=A0ABP4UXV8_9ACTN